jgi:hypothetical protein
MAKRRWLRRAIGLGLLSGAAYAVWRAIEANRIEHEHEWEPQPFPFPPQPRSGTREVGETLTSPPSEPSTPDAWVEPTDGTCPASHPVKAKLSSRIFHVPGGQHYERTVPDRCYVDPDAAHAEGFRPAKR